VTVFALMFVIGAVAYVIMFALKRSGAHRISNIHVWPGRRSLMLTRVLWIFGAPCAFTIG
jgi:hypothetical protein